jgi:two-component system chemotaxis sensor kinase CheA
MSDPSTTDIFREELREHLQELDAAILDLDRDSSDQEAVNRIFRALHSIKGACDMFGLVGAVDLLHDIESLWDRVRGGSMDSSRELMDLTFAVRDRMEPVAASGQDIPADATFIARMALLADRREVPAHPVPAQACVPETASTGTFGNAFRIHLAPSDPGHFNTMSPESFLSELCSLGRAVVIADPSQVPCLEDLDPADCRLRWQVDLETDKSLDDVRDVFLFLENPGDVRVEELPRPNAAEATAHSVPPAGPDAQVPAPAPAQTRAQAPAPGPTAAQAASRPQAPAQAEPAKAKPKEPAQSLRVEAAKLDNLVNLVGELVIAQARLTQVSSTFTSPELTGVAEEIERLSAELRDNTLGIRMVPIGTTFSRFRRLVRDLSSELGKEIELTAEGGETELDKTVIEQLGDPLVHLLRNSIDHGVELPAERAQAGKPARGAIRLSASQAGGSVIIRIADDGRGLDVARIKAKAAKQGILSPDARLTDQEAFQLIFAPGFSTAEQVTSVSGRGVGMDVVKRSIESLRGSVEIASTLGRGAVITITLPLTLAIIDGLQVRAAEEFYIIPLSLVEECVELDRASLRRDPRDRTLSIRGEIVPYIRLRESFALGGRAPGLEQVVVTRLEDGRAGIAVDEVIGQQQTVIKNLGRYIGKVEGISGATINGDGTMALILDVPQLVGSVQRDAGSLGA